MFEGDLGIRREVGDSASPSAAVGAAVIPPCLPIGVGLFPADCQEYRFFDFSGDGSDEFGELTRQAGIETATSSLIFIYINIKYHVYGNVVVGDSVVEARRGKLENCIFSPSSLSFDTIG